MNVPLSLVCIGVVEGNQRSVSHPRGEIYRVGFLIVYRIREYNLCRGMWIGDVKSV